MFSPAAITGAATLIGSQIGPRWAALLSLPADLSRTARLIVRNRPSCDPTPSRQDISLTRVPVEAAKHLKIQVHDHVIIGAEGHRSLKAMELI
jgi:DNA repair protein RadC